MSYNVGDTLCNCTLLQKCGAGAYGEVWLARDAIGTRVALKILCNRSRYSERELAGLKNYKDCNHPNLLKIRYVEINDDLICYTMDAADDLNHGHGEYLPDTLANRLNKFGRLDGKEITAMIEDLLAGLEELHKHGLVHRDIKPDNILWVNGRATLADVGLIANDGDNSLVGTPGFLSPRVLEGNPAEACDDFYALGKVIYCAMTGLAAKEYPSLPADMTISMDANLNRAVRESCSNPVHSTAEFRELLSQKRKIPAKKKFPWRPALQAIGIIIGVWAGIAAYGFMKQRVIQISIAHRDKAAETEVEKTTDVSAPVANSQWEEELDKTLTEARKRISEISGESKRLEKEFLEDRFQRAMKWFRRFDLLRGHRLQEILGHQLFTLDSIKTELDKQSNLSFGRPEWRELLHLHSTLTLPNSQKPDPTAIKARQEYWKKQQGEAEDIACRMLTEDPVMQLAAVNMILEEFCRLALTKKEFSGELKENIKDLLTLQSDFANPEMALTNYMSNLQAQKISQMP